jgi:hypothetical protein
MISGTPDALWLLALQELKGLPTALKGKQHEGLPLPGIGLQLENLRARRKAANGHLPQAMWKKLITGLKV